MIPDEKKAVALYAVLDRDACDFIDMVKEAPVGCLKILYAMLSTPNPKHNGGIREVNEIGARIVDREREARLAQLPRPRRGPAAAWPGVCDCGLERGHRVSEIKLRNKPDSVYVDCSCGAGECVGVWFSRPPLGWDPEGWDLVMTAIKAFLEYDQ